MNIENQITSAKKDIARHFRKCGWVGASQAYYDEAMIHYLFGALLNGRESHDKAAPCSYYRVKAAAENDRNTSMVVYGAFPKFFYEQFDVTKPNLTYEIHCTVGDSWYAHPDTPSDAQFYNLPPHTLRVSPESFLSFLGEFDALVPAIRQAAADLRTELLATRLSGDIRHITADSLIGGHLTPKGIGVQVSYLNDDIILRHRLSGRMTVRVRIPFKDAHARIPELPDLFSHPEEGMRRYGRDFRLEKARK